MCRVQGCSPPSLTHGVSVVPGLKSFLLLGSVLPWLSSATPSDKRHWRLLASGGHVDHSAATGLKGCSGMGDQCWYQEPTAPGFHGDTHRKMLNEHFKNKFRLLPHPGKLSYTDWSCAILSVQMDLTGQQHRVQVVGHIPSGLSPPVLPLSQARELFLPALSVALLASVSSSAMGSVFAHKHGYCTSVRHHSLILTFAAVLAVIIVVNLQGTLAQPEMCVLWKI
ncbi:solute carrier family 26 member 6-like isoform X1 [Lates japonicus]|uniref:Solute carrier family 26 member 6-like isoform X1 n=1 Tax=Lates japonicus TaxID=270547 RepID=A0AAD3M1E4_LATJO|nr:solute carrier family 26 member 6-like isoform X1 [Lates japonicus]